MNGVFLFQEDVKDGCKPAVRKLKHINLTHQNVSHIPAGPNADELPSSASLRVVGFEIRHKVYVQVELSFMLHLFPFHQQVLKLSDLLEAPGSLCIKKHQLHNEYHQFISDFHKMRPNQTF